MSTGYAMASSAALHLREDIASAISDADCQCRSELDPQVTASDLSEAEHKDMTRQVCLKPKWLQGYTEKHCESHSYCLHS